MLGPSQPHVLATSYHSPQLEVDLKLNTNESPLTPPEGFLREVANQIRRSSLNRYPDRQAMELRTRLGELHGVGAEAVFVGNGSNEVLQTIFLAYGGPGRSAWVAQPTYGMYAQIGATTRTEVVSGGRNQHGELTADTIASDVSMVVICDPNNPTGMVEPVELRSLPSMRSDQFFLVDRAYHDFDQREIPEWGGENVAVVRTFSKAFSLAGLRLGYVIADPAVIDALYGIVLPYHLSALTQVVALTALDWRQELQAMVGVVIVEREAMISRLASMGLSPYPSATNFILVDMGVHDAHELWQLLLERSILVRDASQWPGVGNGLRITIGTPEENARLLSALEEVLS
ncbi:aminotransferase class I/II-fold pyridoxal phosphate-dependent enzyme [Ferrimicrobium sp.]|uniref:pyridoxal phosphate-dependent aminotransferase n=1 Tax=Ferrimicrobium sp. TaxID=2926050 RepID=UPI002615453D|nr:aminotransferase class I/II-fold pyridoxal phosphate-dependent enzyme [Ferrimicrobium sp.]